MAKLSASVIRDVVRFIDEVGTDVFHIDTSYPRYIGCSGFPVLIL